LLQPEGLIAAPPISRPGHRNKPVANPTKDNNRSTQNRLRQRSRQLDIESCGLWADI